ncbi:conjugal transfer protein TraH [Shewanella oncorhynchi]|uniref:conjugal transfer protein TraH n=1 Tax=Shewanella TaxID=22 RepID=UPI0039AF8F3E
MKKRIVVALLCCPFSATAASGLNNLWDQMLSASSGANQYSGAKRDGFSLGSASVRIKTTNEKIVAVRAPYLQSSCKGIDFFGGSLSIIKREELVQMARSIAASAPMYAFQLAMGMLCPDCNAILADLAKRLNALNEYISKDCEEWANVAEQQWPSLQVQSDRKMWKAYSETANNWFDSQASATVERSAITSHSKAAQMTLGGEEMQFNSVYETFIQSETTVPTLSSDRHIVAQMMMTILGTEIYKFDSTLTASSEEGSDAVSKAFSPQITLKDLYQPQATTSMAAAKPMVVCEQAQSADKQCLSAKVATIQPNDPRYLDSFYRFYGDAICGLVDPNLAGSSIMALYAQKGTYSASQDQIMANMRSDLENIIKTASTINVINTGNCKFISEFMAIEATQQLLDGLRISAVKMASTDKGQRGAYLSKLIEKVDALTLERDEMATRKREMEGELQSQLFFRASMKGK